MTIEEFDAIAQYSLDPYKNFRLLVSLIRQSITNLDESGEATMDYGVAEIEFDGEQTTFVLEHNVTNIDPEKSIMQLTFFDGGNLAFIQGRRILADNTITFECDSAPTGNQTLYWLVMR
jgi:hypothetical protein